MEIKAKIENWVKATTLLSQITLTHPKEIKNGDYAFFAGGQAEEFGQNLVKNRISEIEKVEVVGPFVNLYLTKEFFASKVDEINKAKENFGQTKLLDQQKIIIEYTNTNVLKPLHIGHLMGNVIGQSLSNIFEASGAEIKRNTYQGDVGLHIAKAVWGILKLREKGGNVGETLSEKSNFIGSAYEVGSVNYDLAGIEQEEIKEINKKLYERSDENIMEVYEWGRKVSLDHFEELYKKLNTKFDYYFFESEVANESLKIIEEYFKKGIFEESENAIVFKGEKYDPKLHTRVFVSSQGIPMYEAKDIAHALRKEQKYIADKSIIITANEQDGYFKVVLKALEQINPLVAKKTTHLSHGLLKLADGKMSSRKGNIITGESLIVNVENLIKEKIKDREFSKEEKKSVAEMVAIGAIKYSILRQAIGGDIIFDFDKSISFEGDSGPYLQYTYVRAKSVLEKAKDLTPGPSPRLGEGGGEKIPESWETIDLEKIIYRFREVVERAGREYAPHYLVTYLTELASTFNAFYANEKIIDPTNETASTYKLALTQATAHVLKNGLHLLGIKVPDKM